MFAAKFLPIIHIQAPCNLFYKLVVTNYATNLLFSKHFFSADSNNYVTKYLFS
jgi:hypothetical protein